MSKPKYMKGDCIRSLDDLVLQENIFWNGRIWNRKWFMNLQIQLLLSLIKHKALQYAVRLDGITTGVFVEPVLWHKLNERPLTDAEKSEFSEHGYLDFEIPEYMFDCPMPDDEQEILIATEWGVDKDVCRVDTDDWGNHSFGLEGCGDWDGVIAWAENPKYDLEGK